MKLEATGFKDTKRIVDGETVVGLAMLYANGKWAPHSVSDDRLAPASFETAAKVRAWFEEQERREERQMD